MNIWDILILAGVLMIGFLALRTIRKTKKSGGCSACGNNCGCEKCKGRKTGF